MATFVLDDLSKFDPESDPDRPQLGIVAHRDKTIDVKEVGWVPMKELVKEILKNQKNQTESEIMNPKGYDLCLMRHHSTRLPVIWLIYGNLVSSY